MESGSKIKRKAMEFINTRMGHFTRVSGLMICNMARVKSNGQKKVHLQVILSTAQSMEKANTFGRMEAIILETGMKIRSKEWVLTLGMMVVCTKVNGKIATCMAKDVILGKMAELTKVNITMIRSTATGFTLGLMADDMKVVGIEVSSTVRALIFSQGKKLKLAFGMRGSE